MQAQTLLLARRLLAPAHVLCCSHAAVMTRSFASSAAGKAFKPSLTLSDLRDNPGANKPRHRKGRGEGSGMGKYATRGMKGAKSRAGGAVRPGFEGGQSPLWRKTPKIGYMPAFIRNPMEPLNLDRLQYAIDTLRIDPSKKITMKTLVDAGLITKIEHGVKVLGRGADKFTAKIDIEVTQVSASAIQAIEALGGAVKSVYYTPLALRALLQPDKFDLPIKSPRPPPKLADYYRSFESRGYLSPEVQLRELERRLAAGTPLEEAAKLMPIYAGGPVHVAEPAGLLPHGATKSIISASQ